MLFKLIETSISASWLVLAVMLLRAACRRIPRWMICLLWALVAVRLVCPFSIESRWSLTPDAEPIAERIVYAVRPGEAPVREEQSAPAGDDPALPDSGARTGGREAGGYAQAVWAAGMGLMAAYALGSYLRLRRRVAASVRVKGNIWICDWIDSPFILGLFRPRIYLPSAMDREQFSYVLAHEHAHLKRLDHWWKPLGFTLLAVYWFKPLLWAAYVLLCRDIELACDERVVRRMGMWEKKVYSEILLACSAGRAAASVCPVGFGGVGVKARVRSVLGYKKPALWAMAAVGAAGVLLAVCFLTDPPEGLAAPAQETGASPAPTPVIHYVTQEDIAALNSPKPQPPGETAFAAMLASEWTDVGYTALTYEEYAERYTQELVPLDRLPEGYKNIGYVLVSADPGSPDQTMAVQILYDWENQSSIYVQQMDMDSRDTEPFYYYTDCDEMGVPHRDNSWFAWRAGYDGVTGGVSVDTRLRSVEDLGAKRCWLILRSLWPDW